MRLSGSFREVYSKLLGVFRSESLACPVILAGILHMCVVRLDLWPFLKKPVDMHLRWRGQRIFGDHKTFRGIGAMVAFSTLFVWICRYLTDNFPAWANFYGHAVRCV